MVWDPRTHPLIEMHGGIYKLRNMAYQQEHLHQWRWVLQERWDFPERTSLSMTVSITRTRRLTSKNIFINDGEYYENAENGATKEGDAFRYDSSRVRKEDGHVTRRSWQEESMEFHHDYFVFCLGLSIHPSKHCPSIAQALLILCVLSSKSAHFAISTILTHIIPPCHLI